MFIKLDAKGIDVLKTLSSQTRVDIISILSRSPSSVTKVAKELALSKAIVSRHFRLLEDSRIIKLIDTESFSDNRRKEFTLAVDHIEIDFPKKLHLPFKEIESEIKLGFFSDFHVTPTCGIASPKTPIGELDDPRSFVSNNRIDASLLWFSESGYVEYIVPNELPKSSRLELLELSLEISSEFPESNNNWPSDISFYINDILIGTWTAPGNYSDVRGALTPTWWENHLSQYGVLKHIRITHKDTGIDGKHASPINLDDLNLDKSPFIKVKISVDSNSIHKGGLTIFGDSFGNHPQNILLRYYYTENG